MKSSTTINEHIGDVQNESMLLNGDNLGVSKNDGLDYVYSISSTVKEYQ